jgi:hypothetical protein
MVSSFGFVNMEIEPNLYFRLTKGSLAQYDGSCDFENPSGLCGYTQDITDNFDWTRQRGRTASSGTGPSSDHTTSTGLNVEGMVGLY